jgi:ribonuclease HI
LPKITIYTDGACRGNPGRGGYGILMLSGEHQKEMSAGYKFTTNNRMELLAVIVALETIKVPDCEVHIFTDSKYVVEAIEKKWLWGWVKKNFKDKKNPDLWKRYLLLHPQHKITFHWVKGHASNAGNNRCDELATQAADGKGLLIDEVYEKENGKA